MADLDQKIKEAEKKLKETPVNKATEKERARLKSKIAKLKEKKEKKSKGKGGGKGYSVSKKGDATISLVGMPSTGKSTLLNKLTNAESEVGDYEFTTLEVVQGMMDYKGAKIQILDVPGLIGGASKGKGRGKEVLSVIRNSDLVLILTESSDIQGAEKIKKELYDAGVRLDKEEPKIDIKKEEKGGINISTLTDLELEEETIKDVLRENSYVNCKAVIKEDLDLDELIDGIMKDRVYLPSLVALNKIDQLDEEEFQKPIKEHPDFIFISAEEEENLEKLKEEIWKKLGLIRIYMKEKGEKPDKEEPLIIKRESTVEEAAREIHKDFKNRMDYVRIWGPSSKFPGQRVGEEHVLKDQDILELHTK